MQNGNERDNQEIMLYLNESQLRDSQRLFSDLSQRCFDACVSTFSTSHLQPKEKTCINNCSQRYMAHFQRVGIRFGKFFDFMREDSRSMAQFNVPYPFLFYVYLFQLRRMLRSRLPRDNKTSSSWETCDSTDVYLSRQVSLATL